MKNSTVKKVLSFLTILTITCVFFLGTYLNAQEKANAINDQESIDKVLNADGTIRKGESGSFNASGYNLSYGKNNEPILTKINKTNSAVAWYPLGTGVNSQVYAIAVNAAGNVYVGGGFSIVNGTTIRCIAKWNPINSTWSALGTGIAGSVNAIAVSGSGASEVVYAGGQFYQAGGMTVNYIAKWNGTSWSALGTGIAFEDGGDGIVKALAVNGNNVYAGGMFYYLGNGTTSANSIAKWNGTSWSALGTGLDGTVNAIAVSGSGASEVVYVGGSFTTAGGATANRIARWNPTNSTWSALGTGTGNGLGGSVSAIAVYGNDVYVGGGFNTAGGATANRIAKWNTTTGWEPIMDGTKNGISSYFVNSLAVNPIEGKMYVGGDFNDAGTTTLSRIARFSDAGNPLPVELVSITAGVEGKSVVLNWRTATEINNYGFEIERSLVISH